MSKWTALLLSLASLTTLAADPKKPAPPQEFKTPIEVIQTVPANLYPANAKGWTDIRISNVNDVLKQKAKDKTATFALTVREVKVIKEAQPDLRLAVVAEPIQVGQTTVHIWCYFDEDQKPRLTTLNPGDKLTLTGKVWNPRFERQKDNTVPLIIDLYKCDVSGDRKAIK
jgi:hypothetical protein